MKFAKELIIIGLKEALIDAAKNGYRQLTLRSITNAQRDWLIENGFEIKTGYDYVVSWWQ